MNAAIMSSPSIALPALPYERNALQPVISGNTLNFHYGKHHQTYVDTLNKLIVGTEFADMPLEKIVKATAGESDHTAVFHNAAQAWNHTFYWRSLKPNGGGEPPIALKRLMEASFGGQPKAVGCADSRPCFNAPETALRAALVVSGYGACGIISWRPRGSVRAYGNEVFVWATVPSPAVKR